MRRTWVAVTAALAVIGLLLGLPAPRRPAVATGTASGPPTLASVWPDAKPFPIPAALPDGSYAPALVIDAQTSMGTVASGDGLRTDLDLVPASGPVRVLQAQLVADGGSFDGLAYTAERLYWMHTVSDTNGKGHVGLWTAPRTGSGPARQLSVDVGTPVFYGSGYDVQAVGDRLFWAATRPGHPDQTEIRSIPQAGGPVAVQVIPGAWAMSTWPWLVTAPSASDQPVRLQNLATRQVVTVRAPANKQVTCSPTWCRMIPDNAAQATETDLIRPDGSDVRKIGDANAAAIASDVALLDRYEILMTVLNDTGSIPVSRLTLYDIAHRRAVLMSQAATNAGGRGAFVWWATGDNETLAWHGLDLRTLS